MMPKEFGFYLTQGVVNRCSKDMDRAEFLINESNTSFEGLIERMDKIGINDKNANSIIKDCYDIMMELIRAKLFLEGYKASGQHAHEAEVSFLMEIKFLPADVSFLNEIRHFRNSITYYGKILDAEYATKVFEFMRRFSFVV